MILFSAIAFVGFWYTVARLWYFDGPKISLAFVVLWVLAFFAVGGLKLGAHIFLGIEAVLGLTLIVICGFREPL